jgi:hypothetical protein
VTGRPIIDESEWDAALLDRYIRPFPPDRYGKAVAVAAHPDDETLGTSGFLQRLHEQGTEVTLVIATDGEGAFPDSPAGTNWSSRFGPKAFGTPAYAGSVCPTRTWQSTATNSSYGSAPCSPTPRSACCRGPEIHTPTTRPPDGRRCVPRR